MHKETLPTNNELELKKRTFGGVDRTWTMQEYNLMQSRAMTTGHKDYVAILSLARYAGLRLEECFRIDTNDARKSLETVRLFVKGKGGLTRYVPINEPIRITFHGLRHTYAHEQYDKFKSEGYSDYRARKNVSELLGHHRDDVTRIYLSDGDENA